MEKLPELGTESSVHSTFRLIVKDPAHHPSQVSSSKDATGKLIALEPFHLPGSLVVQKGGDKNLAVEHSNSNEDCSVFRVVSGLEGNSNTVSLESVNGKGCYIHTSKKYSSVRKLKLGCISGDPEMEFKHRASFVLRDGIASYHPISFVAKGVNRNFLLAPLNSLRDESYTVYFQFQDSEGKSTRNKNTEKKRTGTGNNFPVHVP